MSDVAYFQPTLRTSAAILGEPPSEVLELCLASMLLPAKELGVYVKLAIRLWQAGRLPTGEKALAGVARIGPKAFAKMTPLLVDFFDAAGGRWDNMDMGEVRAERLGRRPADALTIERGSAQRPVDPRISAARSLAGIEGNRRKKEKRQAQFDLLQGGTPTDDATQIEAPFANPHANDVAKGEDFDGDQTVISLHALRSFASGGASHAPGPSDRSSNLQTVEEIEETDGRTEADGASAGDRKPDAVAADADRKPDADEHLPGHANLADAQIAAVANDGGASIANPVDLASRSPNRAGTPSAVIPDDATIIAALGRAGGAKLPASLLTPQGIEPIRELLREGCQLARDVVPAFQATVPGLSGDLRSLRANFIREGSRANRDHARATEATAAASATRAASMVFVEVDTPPWAAWLEHKRVKSLPLFERDGRQGWLMPSLWPPGHPRGFAN